MLCLKQVNIARLQVRFGLNCARFRAGVASRSRSEPKVLRFSRALKHTRTKPVSLALRTLFHPFSLLLISSMARTKQTPSVSSAGKTARKQLAMKQHKSEKALKASNASGTEEKQRKKPRFSLITKAKHNRTAAIKRERQGKMWQTQASTMRMSRDAILENSNGAEDASSVRVTARAIDVLNAFVQKTTKDIMQHAYDNQQRIKGQDQSAVLRLQPRWVLGALTAFSDFSGVTLVTEFNHIAQQVPQYEDVRY